MKKDKVDKLTDKAFFRLIITSVLAIVFCLFCLCSTTWAWFSESETSSSSSIRSANCTLSITVAKDANNKIDIGFEDGEKTVDLEADVEYTVTLSIPQDSASGYCIISLNGVDMYMYSQSVSNNGAPYERTLSFTVVADADTKVKFAPSWGIYSGDSVIQNGETVLISANTFVIETESETESASESESESESESKSESESESKSESESESNSVGE